MSYSAARRQKHLNDEARQGASMRIQADLYDKSIVDAKPRRLHLISATQKDTRSQDFITALDNSVKAKDLATQVDKIKSAQ